MSKLEEHFKEKFGAPDRVIDVPFGEGRIKVAVIDPRPDLDIPETTMVTLGLSSKDDRDYELCLCVVGAFTDEQAAAVVRSAMERLPAHGMCRNGELTDGGLALFDANGIDALFFADRWLTEEDHLDEDDATIRLMEPVPLFRNELDALKGEHMDDRAAIVHRSGVAHRDPHRKPEQVGLAQRAALAVWTMVLEWYEQHGVGQYEDLAGSLQADRAVPDLRLSHDGTPLDIPPSFLASLAVMDQEVHVNSYSLFTAERVKEIHADMNELLSDGTFDTYHQNVLESDRIVPRWWHPAWVPFAMNSGGDLLCIDLSPGPEGVKGQVINFFNDQGPSETGYASYFQWLLAYKSDLQAGSYQVTDSGMIEEAS